MAGELTLGVTLSRPVIPSLATEQLVYALVEMRPAEQAAPAALPLNLCLVLDRSGSMKGRKIDALRAATWQLIDLLQPQDTLAVIVFNNRTQTIVPAQPMTPERKAAVIAEVRRFEAEGGTRMAPAMEAGLIELRKRRDTAGGAPGGLVTRLVLLTDGITEREKRCVRQAEAAAALGIPIVALGIGRDWNDQLLQAIATTTRGTADYVQAPEDIARHFQRTVEQMQAVALQQAHLHVRTVAGVTPRTVFRAFPLIGRLAGTLPGTRDVEAPLDEIERTGQTLLLEFVVPNRPPGTYRIATLTVGYQVPGSAAGPQQAGAEVLLTFTADPAQASPPNPRVMNVVEKITAFKLQTRALEDLEAGNVEGATSKLQGAVTRLLSQGDVSLAQTVQQEIENLQRARAMSPEGRKTIRFGSPHTVRLDQ